MSSCRNEPSLNSTLPRSWRRQCTYNTIVQLTAWRKPSRSPEPRSQGTGRRATTGSHVAGRLERGCWHHWAAARLAGFLTSPTPHLPSLSPPGGYRKHGAITIYSRNTQKGAGGLQLCPHNVLRIRYQALIKKETERKREIHSSALSPSLW